MLSLFLALPLAALALDINHPASIAAQYNLPSHTSLAFPSATLASTDTSSFLTQSSQWQITNKGHVAQVEDISFVKDPFDDSSSGPVMAVQYPAGSYSGGTGGAEFATYFNGSSTPFQTMLLSYQVAFNQSFNWVKGGKLPGLRGGSLDGCSGGKVTTSCFSTRLMWRTEGEGEAYTYTPSPKGFCNKKGVLCNTDGFGTSLDRGSFSFNGGSWNNISMLVALNNPVDHANGRIIVYFNGVVAIQRSDVQIRSTKDITGFTGLFFSTFFGGNDNSWATPTNQTAYWKNIEMWGSASPSNATSAASPLFRRPSILGGVGAGLVAVALAL